MPEPYVTILATVRSRWDEVETVRVASMPRWAWREMPHRKEWKAAYRRAVLEDRTTDPRGWRVEFTAVDEGEGTS